MDMIAFQVRGWELVVADLKPDVLARVAPRIRQSTRIAAQRYALEVPVVVSGGLSDEDAALRAFDESGAAAVMLARGSLGNPWLFEQVLGTREAAPDPGEVAAEWQWVLDRAEEHLGPDRAARYLRKFHPWYVERLGAPRTVQDALQRASTLDEQRLVIADFGATMLARAAV